MRTAKIIRLTILVTYVYLPSISFAESNFECKGFSTAIYNSNDTSIAVCHSLHMKVKRLLLEQWQDCTDAIIYIRNKNINSNTPKVHTDCLPTTHKEFKVNQNTLLIKHYYNEYSSSELKPLLIEEYNIINNTTKYTLVTKLPSYTKKEVSDAISKLNEEVLKPFNGSTYFNNVYRGFFVLRDYSQIDPEFALNKLEEYGNSDKFSGEVSEVLNDVLREARLISFTKKK